LKPKEISFINIILRVPVSVAVLSSCGVFDTILVSGGSGKMADELWHEKQLQKSMT
jgi:hypothetical protein